MESNSMGVDSTQQWYHVQPKYGPRGWKWNKAYTIDKDSRGELTGCQGQSVTYDNFDSSTMYDILPKLCVQIQLPIHDMDF